MPTVKIDINTGLEYSPTDGIDSGVKLHNFTVGPDGSLYKLPVLRNLKTVQYKNLGTEEGIEKILPYRIHDLKKFQTNSLNLLASSTAENSAIEMLMYRRLVFLTTGSYGVVDNDYTGERVGYKIPADQQEKYGEFEYSVFQYKRNTSETTDQISISSLNPSILVDFNAQYPSADSRIPTDPMRCIFPMQYMWQSREDSEYNFSMLPRNIIHCSMNATSGDPDVQPLRLKDTDEKQSKNDLARGTVLIGNRMFFYSTFTNALYVSDKNNFRELFPSESSALDPTRIVPPEELQGLTEFNGNIITFTPTGINRWVLSDDDEKLIQRDPTFNYDHRIRFSGSFVRANRDLYYYTDDFSAYRMTPDLNVSNIFDGNLPFYKPLEEYLGKDKDLPMAYFNMLGYWFVSFGPWLYNIDSNTWSTYQYNGFEKPEEDTTNKEYIFENNTIAGCFSGGSDNIVATHSSICHPLSYKDMQDLPDDIEPSWIENEYNYGSLAFFTTRMFQDEQKFSLDGVLVYVRGGILPKGSKLYLKVLRGSDPGDFDEKDVSTYGIPALYEPINAEKLGETDKEYVGRFEWKGMNLKTDRFRLQFITTEKKGIVIQSVMANITTPSDSEKFLVERGQQRKEQQQ